MKVNGVGGFGNRFAIDADFERTSRVEEVEALEWVLGVANDTDVFFKPCVLNTRLAYVL